MLPPLEAPEGSRSNELQQQLACVIAAKGVKPRTLVAGAGRRWSDFSNLGDISCWEHVRTGLLKRHLIIGTGELHVRASIDYLR